MERLVIASMHENAGKTSMIVGMGKALGKKIGYMKPFGDRMLYRKKRLWDTDSAAITNIFGLDMPPDDMTIGFDHSKLRFMYNEKTIKAKFLQDCEDVEKGNDLIFIEGGRGPRNGMSVYLDVLSTARYSGGKLIFVLAGDDNSILDDTTFIKKHLNLKGIDFRGVILNKINSIEDFQDHCLPLIKASGIEVLGMVPYMKELTSYSVSYLSERLFAKVIVGGSGMARDVKKIVIGAMRADAVMDLPLFKTSGKVVITSGDRSDMISAALETNTAAIVLTNNILPTSVLISKAESENIPLLLVAADTYQTAKQVDTLQPLITKDDTDKINMLERTVKERIKLNRIIGK
jgi:BioD-like phosphotransacetylase family protein